jgi:hypothetical protein
LTLCAVVVAWEVTGAVILDASSMLHDRLSVLLIATAVIFLGLPPIYAGIAIVAYIRKRGRD